MEAYVVIATVSHAKHFTGFSSENDPFSLRLHWLSHVEKSQVTNAETGIQAKTGHTFGSSACLILMKLLDNISMLPCGVFIISSAYNVHALTTLLCQCLTGGGSLE